MPIYEYRCKSCGTVIEVIQRFADRPLRKCRSCSGRLQKLISRTSFQLKGGGWYAQGYGKSGSSKDSKETKKTTKSGEDSNKTESKKTESKKQASTAGKKD